MRLMMDAKQRRQESQAMDVAKVGGRAIEELITNEGDNGEEDDKGIDGDASDKGERMRKKSVHPSNSRISFLAEKTLPASRQYSFANLVLSHMYLSRIKVSPWGAERMHTGLAQ